jgi:uncharacterized protein YjbI with pentapeptide repeats
MMRDTLTALIPISLHWERVMANKEHLEILGRGVEAWNKWRSENPEIRPNLSGAELISSNLNDVNLAGADLYGANLSGSDLSGANLIYAELIGANLRDANLNKANLSGAELGRAELSDANLGDAKLSGVKLNEATLRGVNLRGADLFDADLRDTDLRRAKLIGANLPYANLRYADLRRANLRDATLRGANFGDANLSGASLISAELHGANLHGANLHSARLRDTNVSGAIAEDTAFTDIDLREVGGLESIVHRGPSTISVSTIYRSEGRIPEVFLRGCGLPESFIVQIPALVAAMQPIQFYSCFISYSSKDEEPAQRLHADLQSKGVRCWFAPEDLKIGERFRRRIDEVIRVYDRLLLILSEHSVTSSWVEKEVETAMESEDEQKRTVLFPVRLDDSVMEIKTGWPADVRRTRHIGDFRRWKEHNEYQKAFARLLADLKASA